MRARPHYLRVLSQRWGRAPIIWGRAPIIWGRTPIIMGALHNQQALFHLSKPSPTYLPATSADSPPSLYLGHGGATHPSPKSRLKEHTWGMVSSVCGLWPQCEQLETTQAATLKSGSGRILLQFLNLPGWGENCIGKFSRHTPLHTVSWWIRKLSCIEEVPRFFFCIQFKIKLKNFKWLQLKLNRDLIWGIWPVHF